MSEANSILGNAKGESLWHWEERTKFAEGRCLKDSYCLLVYIGLSTKLHVVSLPNFTQNPTKLHGFPLPKFTRWQRENAAYTKLHVRILTIIPNFTNWQTVSYQTSREFWGNHTKLHVVLPVFIEKPYQTSRGLLTQSDDGFLFNWGRGVM